MPEPSVLEHLIRLQCDLISSPEKEWPETLDAGLQRLPGVTKVILEALPVEGSGEYEQIFTIMLSGRPALHVRLQLAEPEAFAPYVRHVELLCHTLEGILSLRHTSASAADRDWYRSLVATLRDPILVADLESGLLTVCNAAAEDFFGRSQEELVGKPFCALLTPDAERECVDSATFLRRLVETNEVIEVGFETPDGELRFASLRMNALEIGGQLSVAGMLRDITRQKSLQRKLDTSRKDLDNFRMLLESMANNMHDMLWAKDTQGRYLFANPAIRQTLLCSDDEEVIGKTDIHFALRQRAMGQKHTFGELCVNSDDVVLETLVPGRFEEDGFIRGQYIMLDVQKSPLYDTDGNLIGTVGTGRDITARKQAEEELRTKSAMLEAQVNASLDGILVVNEHGARVLFNQKLVEMFSPPEEILHINDDTPLLEHVTKQVRDPEAFRARVEELYADPCNISREELELNDGRFIDRYTAPVLGQDSTYYGRIWMFRDITPSKQAELALRNSRRQLREIIDLVPHFIFAKDAEGRFLLANKALADAYGTTVHKIKGHTDADFSHIPTEVQSFRAIDLKAMQSGQTQIVADEPFTLAGGETRRLSTIKVPFQFSGTNAPAVLGVAVDITDQKLAEQALFRESIRNQILMESSNDGIVIINQDHHVIEANRRFAEMLGYSRKEVLNLCTWDFEAVWSEEEIRKEFPALENVSQIIETKHRRKDGSIFDVEVSMSGTLVGGQALIFAVCRDITSRREFQTTLFHAKEAAESANKAKSSFLANMSHEIRTPLNGLLGMLQLIQTCDISEEVESYSALALQAGKRLTNLLNDILDLSRIEAGRMPLNPEPFSLDELVSTLSETFRLEHLTSEVTLQIGIDGAVPGMVVGDKVRVRQILFNLVGNAIKFTEEGVISVHISLLQPAPDGRARLLFMVSDTGIGIPEHKLNDICLPFTQVAEDFTRSHQGAGLGLSIVRNLVELMDGTMAFDSEQGLGTSIGLMLPFALPDQKRGDQQRLTRMHGRSNPLRILVAEDDEVSALGLEIILERMGHTVRVAASGLEALRTLAAEHFDCVLMDVQMREMDGVQATRLIRQGEYQVLEPEIPVIAVTAYAMDGDREKFLAAGMDGYLAKPVEYEDLREMLAHVANRQSRH